jgi:hypothetical protein
MHWVPASRKNVWQGILYQTGQDTGSVCAWSVAAVFFFSSLHLGDQDDTLLRYGDYIQYEAQHALDAWVDDSQLSATALADFLQDLILPSATTMGTCAAAEANANVFTLVPLPSQHYQVSSASYCTWCLLARQRA